MRMGTNIIGPVSDIYTSEFQFMFSFGGFVLALVACVGSFKMRKSYTSLLSLQMHILLRTYTISLAILTALFFIFMIVAFVIRNEVYRISILAFFLLITLIISAFFLYDKNYSMIFSVNSYISMTNESDQKLFRYVFVSPVVLLTYASVLLYPYIHKLIGIVKIPSTIEQKQPQQQQHFKRHGVLSAVKGQQTKLL